MVVLAIDLCGLAPRAAWAKLPTEARFIAHAKAADVSRIDSTLAPQRFDAWLRELVGPGAAIHWETNDCGESGNAPADVLPVCVEADAHPRGGGRITISLAVGDTERGIVGVPECFYAEIDSLGPAIGADALGALADSLRLARSRLGEYRNLPDRLLDDSTSVAIVRAMRARDLAADLPDISVGEWIESLAVGGPATWSLDGWRERADPWTAEQFGDRWAAVHATIEDPRFLFELSVRIGTFRKGVWGPRLVDVFLWDKRPGHPRDQRPRPGEVAARLAGIRAAR